MDFVPATLSTFTHAINVMCFGVSVWSGSGISICPVLPSNRTAEPNFPSFLTWIDGQRQRKKHGGLRADKVERLEDLGFSWDPNEDAWNRMFQAL